jgi:hypothetical protein
MLLPLMVISISDTASRAHAYGEASSPEGFTGMGSVFRARSSAS